MNTPYRIPTPPSMPRTRYEWVVLWSKDSDVGAVELGAIALLVFAGVISLIFIFGGLCSEMLRALLVLGIFALVWCLAFVRRKPITETSS